MIPECFAFLWDTALKRFHTSHNILLKNTSFFPFCQVKQVAKGVSFQIFGRMFRFCPILPFDILRCVQGDGHLWNKQLPQIVSHTRKNASVCRPGPQKDPAKCQKAKNRPAFRRVCKDVQNQASRLMPVSLEKMWALLPPNASLTAVPAFIAATSASVISMVETTAMMSLP